MCAFSETHQLCATNSKFPMPQLFPRFSAIKFEMCINNSFSLCSFPEENAFLFFVRGDI